MRISSVLFAVIVLILTISFLSMWFYPSVMDFMAGNVDWNGLKNFSDEFNADTVETLDDLPDLLEQTALVTIPYLEYTDEELVRIKRFVTEGGNLLLMDDYGYGNTVLAYLGLDVRFTNKPLLDPLFNYKNPTMPRITDFTSEVKENDIEVIVLNHATSLAGVEAAKVIAWSSATSFLDINGNGTRGQDEPKGPFPIAAEFRLGQGRLALVSDPSIVINSMVDKDDNFSFIKYLTRHAGEKEGFMIDNSHLTKAPLDVSKARLIDSREMLSSPYALLGIIALIFVVVSRYTLNKGGTVD